MYHISSVIAHQQRKSDCVPFQYKSIYFDYRVLLNVKQCRGARTLTFFLPSRTPNSSQQRLMHIFQECYQMMNGFIS